MSTKGWRVVQLLSDAGCYVHAYPVGDLREHLVHPVTQCWCAPRLWNGDILIHKSLDNREMDEATARTWAHADRVMRRLGNG